MSRFVEGLREQFEQETKTKKQAIRNKRKEAFHAERKKRDVLRAKELLRSKSEGHLAESIFPQLVKDFVALNPERFQKTTIEVLRDRSDRAHRSGLKKANRPIRINETSASLCLVLERHRKWKYNLAYNVEKYIAIEAKPDGTITVHGRFMLGNTTLPYETWKNNPLIQEQALKKAYRFPLSYVGVKA